MIAWHDGYPYAAADPCARQLEINTTIAPWDDPNMRRAVNNIIDRTADRERRREGRNRAVTHHVRAVRFNGAVHRCSGCGAGYELSPTADVAAGQALIEAAGYTMGSDGIYEKDGEDLEVKIHVNSASTEYTRTIDVIVEQLNRAGVKASSVPVENGVFWGEVLPFGAYEMSIQLAVLRVGERTLGVHGPLHREGRGSRGRALAELQQHRTLELGSCAEVLGDRRRDGFSAARGSGSCREWWQRPTSTCMGKCRSFHSFSRQS